MNLFRYLFLLIYINPLFAQLETSSQNEMFLLDFKMYREIMEHSHSGLYLYTSEFDSIFNNAEYQIKNNSIKTLRDFNVLLAKVNTHINCGHTNVFPSPVLFDNIKDTQNVFFPLKIKILKDTLIVAETYDELAKGTQIISINGRNLKTLRKDVYTVLSSDGYNTTLKDRYMEEEFSNYYFLLYGETKFFDMEIIPYGKTEIETKNIAGGNKERIEAILPKTEMIDYQLTFSDEKTAILLVNTFDMDQKEFFNFLHNSFKDIREKNIEKLIIDIRQNTGGADGNDTKLASYLIDQPFQDNKYRMLNTVDLPLYPGYIAPEWNEIMDLPEKLTPEEITEELTKMLSEEYNLGNDKKYYIRDEFVCKETPSEYLYKGKIYILISGKVFSAGSLFCALVKDKSDAIFVGEETGGGYYRHTGSYPLKYQLPNSKLTFSLSIVINEQDIDRDLMPFGSGIIPDYEVFQSIYEFVNNIDAVMEFVKGKQKKKACNTR